jgi:hypothetical protein
MRAFTFQNSAGANNRIAPPLVQLIQTQENHAGKPENYDLIDSFVPARQENDTSHLKNFDPHGCQDKFGYPCIKTGIPSN